MSGAAGARVTVARMAENEHERAWERGDFRALRGAAELGARERAAVTVDPAHAVVLAVCTVVLFAIALHYLGAHP